MTSDILDPSAVIAALPPLLPAESKSLGSAQDGVAALIHAAFTALAFRLTAVDDSSTSTSQLPSNVLPTEWNKNGPSHYTFKYKNDQSSLEFVVKVSRLGTRTIINAIASESDKVATLDICTADFTSPSFYPHTLGSSSSPLIHGFISSNRVADLMSQFKLKIVQKLVPGLQKPGYMEESDTAASSSSQRPAARAPRPRPENPPDAPDRNVYPHRSDQGFPRNPLEIGRRDLDPFPGLNPFAPRGSVFPGNDGDGMFAGPDHPIFGAGRGRGNNGPGGLGPWGGDGFLPPMGAPPGARFDPVGPHIPTNNPFGGRGRLLQDPDNDEFMPPGAGDMFM